MTELDDVMTEDGEDVMTVPEPRAIGSWTIPHDVEVHGSVDLDLPDPAEVEGDQRRCIGCRKADRARCGAPATRDGLLCSMHAGRADPRLAALTRHQKAEERRRTAEEALARRSLGTRALIADVLHDKAQQVEQTVGSLLEKAATGDLRAAQALIPWLNQGLGMPTERVQHDLPTDASQLADAPTEALAALVAEGRRRRLSAVPDESTG